jgi:hypothetical protein
VVASRSVRVILVPRKRSSLTTRDLVQFVRFKTPINLKQNSGEITTDACGLQNLGEGAARRITAPRRASLVEIMMKAHEEGKGHIKVEVSQVSRSQPGPNEGVTKSNGRMKR